MKIRFKNISPATLQDKKPGDVFRLEADDNGIPAEAYWRRRLDEKAIEVVRAAAPKPAAPVAPEEDPVPTATVARAARKQKD